MPLVRATHRSPRSSRVQSPSRLLAISLGIVTLAIATPLWAQEPGTWAPMGNLTQARAGHTATLLINGTVLIAGGKDATGQPLASAELYDPATGLSTQLPASLPAPVWGHTATLLNDGSVLIAGGDGGGGLPVAAGPLFDPATVTFTAVGAMTTATGHHTATL